MDKLFWRNLQGNDYVIPTGHTLTSLTAKLYTYLSSTDPELRDEIAYETFANFLLRDYYSLEEIEIYIANLLANLEIGIGESGTDSVFLRAFSVLFLAEIVHNDNKVPQLKKPITKTILEKGLWYLAAERDPRGYVKEKGWAHALAHTADLLLVLGKSHNTGKRDHQMILDDIRAKLVQSTDWVYVHGEEDRLSRAVLEVLRRDTLSTTFLNKWLKSFLMPEGGTWKGAWTKDESTRAFFNVRNFLRSLYLQVTTEEDFPKQDELGETILDAIQELRPY